MNRKYAGNNFNIGFSEGRPIAGHISPEPNVNLEDEEVVYEWRTKKNSEGFGVIQRVWKLCEVANMIFSNIFENFNTSGINRFYRNVYVSSSYGPDGKLKNEEIEYALSYPVIEIKNTIRFSLKPNLNTSNFCSFYFTLETKNAQGIWQEKLTSSNSNNVDNKAIINATRGGVASSKDEGIYKIGIDAIWDGTVFSLCLRSADLMENAIFGEHPFNINIFAYFLNDQVCLFNYTFSPSSSTGTTDLALDSFLSNELSLDSAYKILSRLLYQVPIDDENNDTPRDIDIISNKILIKNNLKFDELEDLYDCSYLRANAKHFVGNKIFYTLNNYTLIDITPS